MRMIRLCVVALAAVTLCAGCDKAPDAGSKSESPATSIFDTNVQEMKSRLGADQVVVIEISGVPDDQADQVMDQLGQLVQGSSFMTYGQDQVVHAAAQYAADPHELAKKVTFATLDRVDTANRVLYFKLN